MTLPAVSMGTPLVSMVLPLSSVIVMLVGTPSIVQARVYTSPACPCSGVAVKLTMLSAALTETDAVAVTSPNAFVARSV